MTCRATRSVISRVSFISATVPVSGIMISGSTLSPSPRHLAGRFHDRAHLHVVDLGERDAEPAAPMPEHRVRLLQGLEPRLQRAQLRVPLRVEAARVEPRILLEHLLVL